MVPEQGDFERAPRGPSATEAAEATYRAMVARGDGRLKTWIERGFAELGWGIIFTPPNCPAFQPIELFWAAGKIGWPATSG